MKKLFLAVTVLCLTFSLTSCGNGGDKPIAERDLENLTEKELEDALLSMEAAEESANAAGQGTPVSTGDSFQAKQEIIDAAWDSGLIQIDDKLIQLPVHLSEWVELGLDYELEYGKVSKDFLYTQGERITLHPTYNGEQLDSLYFTQTSETPQTVEEIDPLIEEIYIRRKPENITMYFPGGLTFGDPYTSIEEKLGKAGEITGNMTYEYGQTRGSQDDMYYGISVFVDRDSQTLLGFSIGKSIQESSRENFTTISFENVPNAHTSDNHNVTLLWASEYKEIPGITTLQRRVDSVLSDSGQKYYMSLSFSMLAQQYANPYEYIEYGDPVLDVTDENGMNRKVYNAGSVYYVVCSTDVHIFKATIKYKNMSDSSEDALAALQDLVIEFANSVQY